MQRRKRRSLSHVGGRVELAGDPTLAGRLAEALHVAASSDDEHDPSRVHVHGFHTYPARMHPTTAAKLVCAFTEPGETVLDPFCGSGTVLVEAMIAGRRAHGIDLNPLAVQLARLKTSAVSDSQSQALIELARGAKVHADDRRARKAGATKRFGHADVRAFEPHVLLELDSLADFLRRQRDPTLREEGGLLLSSILVKLSRKAGDTSSTLLTKRTAAGFASTLLVRKAEELSRRRAEFRGLLPQPFPRVRIEENDALRLQGSNQADAIITSPPYVGTYNYLDHHDLRFRWLGLETRDFARLEMGAQRNYERWSEEEGARAWEGELHDFLSVASRLLRRGGSLLVLMADSALRRRAVRADEFISRIAPNLRLTLAARATQERPHFHRASMGAFRRGPRREHALLLLRS